MRITIRELSAAEKLTKNPEPQRKRRLATPKEKKEKIESLESFSHRSNLWFLPSFSPKNAAQSFGSSSPKECTPGRPKFA
jgi:hypothetical protein